MGRRAGLEGNGALERVLGRVRGERPGPTLICVGGVHGNEPAGVRALGRVLEALRGREPDICGEFVALTGNRKALAAGRRFLGRDLNRAWTTDRVSALANGGKPDPACPEDLEQAELIEVIEAVLDESRGPVAVIDLHTTSGEGGAFTTVADTLSNRELARTLVVPMILGLEELVEGTMLEYLVARGLTGVGFEGGQHEDQRSVDRSEAAIWLGLSGAGVVDEAGMPEVARSRTLLGESSRGRPRFLEMIHRHPVNQEDGFEMREGYENFQLIAEGEVLAKDRSGEVRAPDEALMLMPLYQEQGEDGFFLIRPFRAGWLRVSEVLRRWGVDRFVHWLPGVTRHPTRPGALVANRKVARWYALQLFHLLGYRRQSDDGGRLVVDRQATGGWRTEVAS